MKKGFLVLFILVTSIAFSQRVLEGGKQLNAGIGFASDWGGVPVFVGFDYGVHQDITVGGQISYASKTYATGYYGDYKGTWFGIAANANYHFNTLLEIPNKWDVYAGLTLAYNSFSYDYPNGYNVRNEDSGIGLAAQLGARYYFSNKFGINLEFGGGNITSGGKIGISIRL